MCKDESSRRHFVTSVEVRSCDRSTSSDVVAAGEATYRERERGRIGKAGKQLHQASFQFEDQ